MTIADKNIWKQQAGGALPESVTADYLRSAGNRDIEAIVHVRCSDLVKNNGRKLQINEPLLALLDAFDKAGANSFPGANYNISVFAIRHVIKKDGRTEKWIREKSWEIKNHYFELRTELKNRENGELRTGALVISSEEKLGKSEVGLLKNAHVTMIAPSIIKP